MYIIEAGEEVTLNYMAMAEEGSEVREVRQEYLRRLYGFQCTCKACTLQVSRQGNRTRKQQKLKLISRYFAWHLPKRTLG